MRGRKKDGRERVSGAPFRVGCVNNLRSKWVAYLRPTPVFGGCLAPSKAVAALGRGGLASPG